MYNPARSFWSETHLGAPSQHIRHTAANTTTRFQQRCRVCNGLLCVALPVKHLKFCRPLDPMSLEKELKVWVWNSPLKKSGIYFSSSLRNCGLFSSFSTSGKPLILGVFGDDMTQSLDHNLRLEDYRYSKYSWLGWCECFLYTHVIHICQKSIDYVNRWYNHFFLRF